MVRGDTRGGWNYTSGRTGARGRGMVRAGGGRGKGARWQGDKGVGGDATYPTERAGSACRKPVVEVLCVVPLLENINKAKIIIRCGPGCDREREERGMFFWSLQRVDIAYVQVAVVVERIFFLVLGRLVQLVLLGLVIRTKRGEQGKKEREEGKRRGKKAGRGIRITSPRSVRNTAEKPAQKEAKERHKDQ